MWAKSGSFPWWPALVCDPDSLPRERKIETAKHQGKKYCVYYYGTSSTPQNMYGFISPFSMKKYVDNRDEFAKQIVKQKIWDNLFPTANKEADEDIVLPNSTRLHNRIIKSTDIEEISVSDSKMDFDEAESEGSSQGEDEAQLSDSDSTSHVDDTDEDAEVDSLQFINSSSFVPVQ